MLWRLEQLRRRGIVPTREENNQAVNLDSLLDYLEANFPPGHERERNGRPDQWGEPPSRYDTADDLPEEVRPKSKARSSLQSQAQSSAPTGTDSSRPAPPQSSAGPWDVYNRTPDPGNAASSSTAGAAPKRYQEPLWRWRRREPDRQRKRSASPGTTQTWPRIMMNRGSPADLRWAPVHGSPRAEDGATPIGVADVGVASLVRWLRRLRF